jgi:metal-responsive CopG/Arc/MetJ family transcriptional regulator
MNTAKVAISLPVEVLERVERARHPGQSRSEFIARAIEAYLGSEQARAEAEAYARGYELFPETAEEIEEVDRLGAAVLAREPWD